MRRTILLVTGLAVLPVVLAPVAARAQGALSIQGYGYPTGQLSAGSLGLGGASAELDPASPINPAALSAGTRYSVYMQFEPEFRRTTVGGASASARVMRFPGFLVSGQFRRLTVAASASTFLDRTYRNVYADSQSIGGEMVPSTLIASSNGAMTDARVAAAWWVKETFQVGASVHALVGENRTTFGRSFPDSTGIGGFTQLSTLTYSGGALTIGAVYYPLKGLVLGGSFRRGGSLDAYQDAIVIASGDAPDRLGLTVAWTGIPNTTLAARFEKTTWSDMQSLGGAQMTAFDANELGLGVEVMGPRVAGAPSFTRFGFRSRTLPFGANGDQVSERSLSGGLSVPFARGRAQVDLALQRATRSAAGADEKAWFVSIGLGIRP